MMFLYLFLHDDLSRLDRRLFDLLVRQDDGAEEDELIRQLHPLAQHARGIHSSPGADLAIGTWKHITYHMTHDI